jgi:hypothetical protein
MAKVTIANFDKEIEKILSEYGDEVSENLDQITKRIGQKGAQMLRNESKSAFPVPTSHRKSTGKYAAGWTAKTERNRLYTTVTIYNRTPGLPHLLEHGHAVVAGGRTVGAFSGKTHIAPVEEKLINEYEREVKAKL